MDLIRRDSSLFVCLALDLVWQVSNISIINVSVFYPDPNQCSYKTCSDTIEKLARISQL